MIDNSIIISYLLITLIIGVYKGHGTKTMRSYCVSYKNYTIPIIVATMMATCIDGGMTMGRSREIFSSGITCLVVSLGTPIGLLFAAMFVIPRMKKLSAMMSVGEMMEQYYGRRGRVMTGIGAFFLGVCVIGGQVSALGYILDYFFGLSPLYGIPIAAGIVVIYSAYGGIKGVTATDVIQFGVLIVATPIIFNVGLRCLGGYGNLVSMLPEGHLTLFPTKQSYLQYIPIGALSTIIFLEPTMIQRFLMTRNTKQAVRTFQATSAISFMFVLMGGGIGLVAYALNPLTDASVAYLSVIEHTLPIGIKGMAIAGMLAILMSTADSYLNSASISLVHDVVRPLGLNDISDAKELRLTRIITFVVGFLSIIIALKFKTLMDIFKFSCLFWVPVFIVPFLSAVFGRIISKRAYMTAGILGSGAWVLWDIFLKPTTGLGGFLPGLIVNFIIFHLCYFTQKTKPQINADIEREKVYIGATDGTIIETMQ